eukprot:TRINITY_DN3124_c0_g1_i1.p1 TRINITY_DN3124_c0_g1~~TRINITY_DN3124_c0_g1_i1.p1  ORF type:complete len:384 (+),score=76.60 TRINITY_DN3124_c0_g1_i1:52-1203(+)
MSTSTVLVTGCSQGLGYHCVKALISKSETSPSDQPSSSIPKVIFACRNPTSSSQAAETLLSSLPVDSDKELVKKSLIIPTEPCDLASLESVRKYAAEVISFLESENLKLNALVLNAGIGGLPSHTITKDGYDLIFQTNHLGHFLLTILLLPYTAPNSRIVVVSSEVHDPDAKTTLPDPGQDFPKTGDAEEWNKYLARGDPLPIDGVSTAGTRRYSRSKLCNVLFTYQLARILSGATPSNCAEEVARASKSMTDNNSCKLPHANTMKVVVMNPGLMLETGFVKAIAGGIISNLAYYLTPVIRYLTPLGRLMRTADESGAALARLAVSPQHEDKNAVYFNGDESHPSSAFSRELESVTKRQVELWERSIQWAQVTQDELRRAKLI